MAKVNPVDGAIYSIKQLRDAPRKMAADSPDVKSGKITVEDELAEPEYVLYSNIIESMINVFEQPVITDMFKSIAGYIGDSPTVTLMVLLAAMMSQISHQSIIFYNNSLKDELSDQIDPIINQINTNTADVNAFKAVLEIYKKDISDLKNRQKIDDATKRENL